MKRLHGLVWLGLLVTISGCAQITIKRHTKSLPTLDHYSFDQKILAFGLVNIYKPINLADSCTNGWESITTETTAFQGLLHVLTLNLYGPWHSEVVCAGPTSDVH